MSAHEGDWTYWQKALAGEILDVPKGEVRQGYYRNRSKAIAIWWQDGAVRCQVNDRIFTPHSEAELAEGDWSWCCSAPITHEVFTARIETGKWPEDVSVESKSTAGQQPHEAALAAIDNLKAQFDAWFATLPNGVETEENDAKVASYADAMMAIAKRADEVHKEQKKPFLDGGREVDNRWRVARERPGCIKSEMLRTALSYRQERDRKRREEADRARQEQARAAADAKTKGEPVPIPISAPKPRTGLRSAPVVVIDDRRALCAWIGERNDLPEYVEDALRRYAAEKMDKDGGGVPGARREIQQKAA